MSERVNSVSMEGNIWRCGTVNWAGAAVLRRGKRKRIGGRKMRKSLNRGRRRRQNKI